MQWREFLVKCILFFISFQRKLINEETKCCRRNALSKSSREASEESTHTTFVQKRTDAFTITRPPLPPPRRGRLWCCTLQYVKMQNLPRMYCYAVHHPLRKEYETICTSYTSAIWYIYSSQNRVQRSQVVVLNAQLQLQKEESDTLL